MRIPVDITTLPTPAQKLLDPRAPAALRGMAARGIAPGLKPADALTVLVLLSFSEDAAVAAAASGTLDALPAPLLNGALAGVLPAGIIDVLAPRYAKDAAVAERLVQLQAIHPDTVARMAELSSEAVSELIATNEELLLANPVIIEKLYMNRATRMSTADRLIELAVRNNITLTGIPAFEEAAAAIANELVAEATPEPTPDDIIFVETDKISAELKLDPDKEDTHVLDEVTGEEKVVEKVLPLHSQLAAMTISQRIRRAMLGSSAERLLLVRDTNKLVALAAVKSPMIQENEIVKISNARNVSDAVLGAICRSKTWSQKHEIKYNLVANPRTPFMFVMRFMTHLRDDELKTLSKSKNVSGPVAQAAKQHLQRKVKK